jgi:hypothetical protein
MWIGSEENHHRDSIFLTRTVMSFLTCALSGIGTIHIEASKEALRLPSFSSPNREWSCVGSQHMSSVLARVLFSFLFFLLSRSLLPMLQSCFHRKPSVLILLKLRILDYITD